LYAYIWGSLYPQVLDTIFPHFRLPEEIDMTDQGRETTAARILVVEDEAILAEDLGLSLKNLGYVVKGKVSTGEEAVELAEKLRPDLILMDIKLQGDIDGIEAADQIRKRLDIPVVYLTGYSESDVLERAKKTEPYGYIGKPISVSELRNTIETALYKHNADKRVRESEERLRLAMEATNDGVWDWDISTGETYYSPGYFLMLGLEPGQCTEHFTSWLELIHPEDRQHAWNVNQDCVRGKRETFEVEFRMRHKDGSWRWILGRGKSIARNSEGTSIRLVGTHTDITERKQAEEAVRSARDELEQQVQDRTKELMATNQALRESQSTLRLITDSLPVLISYVDSDQRYRFCNKTYELWRGAPKGEIEGRRLREILGEDAYNEARPYVEAALLGSPVDYEMRATYQDGKEKHLHVIYVPDADEKGVTKGFAALIADITERKKMEEALLNSRNELEERVAQRTADMVIANEELKREIGCRIKTEEALNESEEKYRLLHETMRDAFVSVDMRGRILETNRAYQDMLGYSEEELRKLTYVDLTPERWHAFEARMVEEQIIPKGFSDVYQKEYRRKDGTVFPVELRTFLIRDKAGNPSVMWAIVRDITERTRAEKIIKASLTEKEVLLREIHHRVKNNLAVIQSLLRIQSHHVKNAELTRILEETQHRIRSMALGHELLYQSENLSSINTNQYLDNLLHHLKESFSIMGKRIEIKQETEEVQMSIDMAVPLGFIITELISNCYQHAFPESKDGEIAVSLRYLQGDRVELVVKDDGIGLPEDMGVEKAKSLGYQLIGIFVKQLKGEMEITRQKGTEVRISFPLK
jgi:PAS domain S-box-containing protein